LIQIEKYKFTNDVDYFKYVMKKYLRKSPPIATNIYLNLPHSLDLKNRIKLASICKFPSIINTLSRDENYKVRSAALKNEFWILIGQLQDVLGFGKRERKEFAQQEVFRIIVVLLMFEDDIQIIKEALRNAAISTKMIMIFIQILEERGKGKKDQQILEEAKKILAEKKHHIIKAAEIKKAQKNLEKEENKLIILSKLSDEYKIIRKAVLNVLSDIDPALLNDFIKIAVNQPTENKILSQFIVLTELLKLVKRREDIKNTSLEYLNEEPSTNKLSIAEYFFQLINGKRCELLKLCQQDLTNFQHIKLLTHCYCDSDVQVRNIVKKIIGLDDIFALVNDISTPQQHFKEILEILSTHPNEEIHKRVQTTYQEESNRLWNRLKELEQSQCAYFDLIFQSLGFDQINKFQVAIKTIYQAEHTLNIFSPTFKKSLNKDIQTIKPILTNVKSELQSQINLINSDISGNTLQEMQQIYDMIIQINELQNFGIEGLRPGMIKDIDPELLNKARTIWQSALGQFLGRIKHLNEMIKVKFLKIASKVIDIKELEKDFAEVIMNSEKNHKNNVRCRLKIQCIQCNKRGCAAERFLNETEFFLEEFLDNFIA
jgi:hypothetical protein